jgi:hypothetical protein
MREDLRFSSPVSVETIFHDAPMLVWHRHGFLIGYRQPELLGYRKPLP